MPYLLQIRPAAKYGLLIYSIVVNLFMGFYFFYIIPVFLYKFIRTFPEAVNELILYLSNGMTPPFALFQVYALLAFLQKEELPEEEAGRRPAISAHLLPGIAAVCYIGYLFLVFQQGQDKSYIRQSREAFEKGEYAEAIHRMEQAGEQVSDLVNRGLFYMRYYRETKDPEAVEAADRQTDPGSATG